MVGAWIAWLLLIAAVVLLACAAIGVTNRQFALEPLGLAFAVLALLVRWWPPP